MTVTLKTVEEALGFFEEMGQRDPEKIPRVQFDGELGTLRIEIEGALFDGELTGELARGLAEFQDEIYRATLFALTGLEGRAAKLTIAQKEAVELIIDVESGCTLIDIDLGKFGEGLVGILDKMSPGEVTILVVAVVAVLSAGWLGKNWIAEHYKAKLALAENQGETDRIKAVADSHVALAERIDRVIESSDKVQRFAKASENGVREIATRARGATSVTVGRLPLDEDDIATLKKRAPRSGAESIQTVGNFSVLEANGKSTPFKLTLAGPGLPTEFDAEFDDSEFSEAQVNAVWDALKNRTTVELQINAVLRGEKVKGAILSDVFLPDGA